MFQLTEIVWLFLFSIFLCRQEEYEDVCFIILGEKEKILNLQFNKNLIFVPDYLKIEISTTENLYDKILDEIKRNTYILAKANNSCSDPFVYEVPWSSQMILTVNMILSWGEKPSVIIDTNKMVVRPDFEHSYHEWDGLLKRLRLKIYLKHEKLSKTYLQQISYLTPNIDWNGKVRGLFPGEAYCLNLLTLNFFGILIFAQPPIERIAILKYYLFKIKVFGKENNLFTPNELIYIGFVFPCRLSLAFNSKLKIFIKPKYYKIQFKLIENYEKNSHIAEYVYHRGRFKLNATNSNFSFTYFEIKPAIFSIEMFTRKTSILIYKHFESNKFCEARIPENIYNLNISTVIWQYVDRYMVRFHYFKVDMSTHEYGVYKIRRGSQFEYLQILQNINI